MWWWPLLAAILLIIDQVVKWLFVSRQPMIDWGWLRLHLVYNRGSAFGLVQDANVLLLWVAIIVLGLFVFFARQTPQRFMPFAIIAAAGALGNAIDRFFRGAVVDFIDLGWWPVFNIADSMIVVGVLVIAGMMVLEDVKRFRKN